MSAVLDFVSLILHKLPNNSIVVAPGDSPTKIINIINMLYRDNDGLYTYKKSNGSVITKKLTIISFPISKLSVGAIDQTALDSYFLKVLNVNKIDINTLQTELFLYDHDFETRYDDLDKYDKGKIFEYLGNDRQVKFVYLDHTEGGGSYRALKGVIRRFFDRELFDFDMYSIWHDMIYPPTFSLRRLPGCFLTYSSVIADAERLGARCIPRYELGNEIKPINLMRCNVIMAVMYLLALDMLDLSIQHEYINIDEMMGIIESFNSPYTVTYYDNTILKPRQVFSSSISGSSRHQEIWIECYPDECYPDKSIQTFANSIFTIEGS